MFEIMAGRVEKTAEETWRDSIGCLFRLGSIFSHVIEFSSCTSPRKWLCFFCFMNEDTKARGI